VSAYLPLYGGQISRFTDYLAEVLRLKPCDLPEESLRELIVDYGTQYVDVLKYFEPQADPEKALLRARVLHGMREEMALKLGDIVFRRTGLGTASHPGEEKLQFVGKIMQGELGWSGARLDGELQEVNKRFLLFQS
jgi:glycerol-3-phosphate dehydrogenase